MRVSQMLNNSHERVSLFVFLEIAHKCGLHHHIVVCGSTLANYKMQIRIADLTFNHSHVHTHEVARIRA